MQAGLNLKLTGGQPVEERALSVPGFEDGQWEQRMPFLRWAVCFRWFFGLLFGPEDGSDLFIRNIRIYLNYATLDSKR
jgi:hypothetical protein